MKSRGLIRTRKLLKPFNYEVVNSGESDDNLKEVKIKEIVEKIIENDKDKDKETISEKGEYYKDERMKNQKNDKDIKFYVSLLRPQSKEKNCNSKDYLATQSTQSQISMNIKKSLSPRPHTIREIIPENVNKTFSSGVPRAPNKQSTEPPSRRLPYQIKFEPKKFTNLPHKAISPPINSRPTSYPKISKNPSKDYKLFLKKATEITSSKKRCKAQGDLYQSYQSLIHYIPSNPYF